MLSHIHMVLGFIVSFSILWATWEHGENRQLLSESNRRFAFSTVLKTRVHGSPVWFLLCASLYIYILTLKRRVSIWQAQDVLSEWRTKPHNKCHTVLFANRELKARFSGLGQHVSKSPAFFCLPLFFFVPEVCGSWSYMKASRQVFRRFETSHLTNSQFTARSSA